MSDAFTVMPRIAYFSMEIALASDIPTYAGGLGILAGDTLRSAADLELPLVAVSLVSHRGYFRQSIDQQGRQVEQPESWDVAARAELLDAKVGIVIEGRKVWVGGWLYILASHMDRERPIPVILLDTALDENDAADRGLTDSLYGGDQSYRLKQEIVLGIGGVRMLHALGYDIIQYHMNEGHSALLGMELLRRATFPADVLMGGESPYDVPRVRELCCFTTHTPIEAGHDRFAYPMAEGILGDSLDLDILKRLAGRDDLNMTRLALNLSEYVNGVAKRHAEVSRRMFPGYRVHAVTNGVHPFTWTAEPFRGLYDHFLPGWCHEPELLIRADCCIPDDAIWEGHLQAKRALVAMVEARTGKRLSEAEFILGFARRMTAYKRPDLLFADLGRLRRIAAARPLQIVLAGKAHPRDEEGKRLIESLHGHVGDLGDDVPVVFLENYDMEIASALVAGVDTWLNTPSPPREASGTSGMKATLNGVPNLSVLDGWWIEGRIEGVTGWAIGDGDGPSDSDAESLYHKLESDVLPLYYDDRRGWIAVMKAAIAKNASYFTSHRMMRRYASEAYLR